MDGVMNLRRALYPKMLNLIILPTEKCNFRCTYCYETFEMGKIKRPTIDGIKNLIKARIEKGTLEALDLGWFGGEPLLALDAMVEISQYAKDLYDAGVLKQLSGDTTTNGYLLTPKTLRTLVGLKQQTYQVSLDGFGEGHDQTRQYASGAGTFKQIWSNVLAARDSDLDFSMMLRLHLTAENGESISELVDNIIKELKDDRRFTVFFKTIENLGGPNAGSIEKMQKEVAGVRVRALSRLLKDSGFSVSAVLDGPESAREGVDETEGIEARPNAQANPDTGAPAAPKGYGGYICYASKPNSLMIRSDGRIGKCTVMLEDDRNTVGRINPDGTVVLDNDRVSVWMRGFKSMDAMELGCPAQNLPKSEFPVELPPALRKKPKPAVKLAELA